MLELLWDDSYSIHFALSPSPHSLSPMYIILLYSARLTQSYPAPSRQLPMRGKYTYRVIDRTTRISLLFPQTTASAQFSIAVVFVWVMGPLAHFLNQRLWIRLAWAFIFLLPIWQGPQLLTLINQQWVLPRNNSWITSAIRPFPYLQDAWKGQKFPNFPVSKVLWRKTVNQRLIRYMKMHELIFDITIVANL